MFPPDLNLLTATASSLQEGLTNNAFTSVDLIKAYLSQIAKHNHQGLKLHAVICTCPEQILLRTAAALDEERRNGNARGPLHGIPILLKDIIQTGPELGMDTTAGCHAFVGSKSKYNAPFVDRLISKGLIILGKANMTEFCGLKQEKISPGWSAVGGQTQSPYIAGGLVEGEVMLGHSSAGGSSTGSAVSVAAGFAPLAIGSETAGSMTNPSNRAGVYAMKASLDSVPMEGIFGLSRTFDCLGGMAKSAEDLKCLMEVMLERDLGDQERGGDAGSSNIKIGFLDPVEWSLPETLYPKVESANQQVIDAYNDAITRLHWADIYAKTPITLRAPDTLKYEDQPGIGLIACKSALIAFLLAHGTFTNTSCLLVHEFQHVVKDFISHFSSSSISSLADIVSFNEAHPELAFSPACPDQNDLIKARDNTTDPEMIRKAIIEIRRLSREDGLDRAMKEHGVDLIAAPGDSALCVLAAAAGYPIGILPIGKLDLNGRPFGICVVAKAGEEGKLLRFMRGYELVMPARPVPTLFESNDE